MTCLFSICRKAPFNDSNLRKAFSYLVDRELIAGNLTGGFVEPLNTFIPQGLTGWLDNSSRVDFDLKKAWTTLDDASYVINVTSNRRIYPGTGRDLWNLTLYTPPYWEDKAQWETGETVCFYATILRIPIRHLWMAENDLKQMAQTKRKFHIVTMNVTISAPPVELYDLLHSSQDKPSTTAYSGIRDQELDASLQALKDGSEANQKAAAANVQRRLAELNPYTPVYTVTTSQANSVIRFVFNKTGKPSEQGTGSMDTRDLAVAFDDVEFLDKDRR